MIMYQIHQSQTKRALFLARTILHPLFRLAQPQNGAVLTLKWCNINPGINYKHFGGSRRIYKSKVSDMGMTGVIFS